MSENLDILNWQSALNVVSGNSQLANDLLAMFIKELPTYKQNIQTQLQANDKEELKSVIHKIHGGLRYLGAPALMAIVSQTDKSLFDLTEAELKDGIKKIVFEIDRLIAVGRY